MKTSFKEMVEEIKNPLDDIFTQVKKAKDLAESDRSLFMQRDNDSNLYYHGMLPGPTIIEGQNQSQISKDHVEQVLKVAVKNALPQLLDTFTEGKRLAVAFRSRGFKKDFALEELLDDNINRIFHDENEGYFLIENAIRRILITGDAFLKGFVETKTLRDSDDVADWVELSGYMQQLNEGWSIEAPKAFNTDKSGKSKGFEWKETEGVMLDPQTGKPTITEVILIKGKIPLISVKERIVIELVEPSDLWVDTTYGHDFSKCRYICHRIKTTVGEAELMGFDPELLKEASDESTDDLKLPAAYFSKSLYDNPTGGSAGTDTRNDSTDPKERAICLYEHYIYSSLLDKKNQTKPYQIIATDNDILKATEIKRFPFVHGQGETVSGSFFGTSFYDDAKPYQDSLSLFQRLSMQVGRNTAYPSYQAIKGQYDREVLMNMHRPGSVVEVAGAGAVMRFDPLQLPNTFYTAQELIKESASSLLAQPVGSAIDNSIPQVSTASIAMALWQDTQKQMILSKNIERTLIKPLYTLIYNIIRDESFPLKDINGNVVEGLNLPESYDFEIDDKTTNDDLAQNLQMQSIAEFIGKQAQMPSPILSPQNVYEMAKVMMMGFDMDADKFLTDPSQNQDPHAAAEDAEQKALQSEMAKIQVQREVVKMRKDAAEVYKLEAEVEELKRNGAANRNALTETSAIKMAQVQSNAIAARQATAVKDKAVNYEAMLGAAKHATDITSPEINGVR